MKNGAPIMAVTMPIGSSLCVAKALVIVSHITKNRPPKIAVFKIREATVEG